MTILYDGAASFLFLKVPMTKTPDGRWVGKVGDRLLEIESRGDIDVVRLTDGTTHYQAMGHTLGELEKNLVAEIGRRRDEVIDLCEEIQAPPSVKEATYRFLDDWHRLPPLVRAGLGDSMVREQGARHGADMRIAVSYAKAGIARRSRVHQLFAAGSRILQGFFSALMVHADAEAEADGIDADIASTLELTNVNDLDGGKE